MNPNYRNLALWAIIAVLLIALFNLFHTPQQRGASNQVAYSDFLLDRSTGRVKSVIIPSQRISGTSAENSPTFQPSAPPADPLLVQTLKSTELSRVRTGLVCSCRF